MKEEILTIFSRQSLYCSLKVVPFIQTRICSLNLNFIGIHTQI